MTADARSVRLEMPVGETRAKHVHVDFARCALSVIVAGRTRLHGKLYRRIDPNESEWTLETKNDERILVITLAKLTPTCGVLQWPRLLADE